MRTSDTLRQSSNPQIDSHPARQADLGAGLMVSRILPSRQRRLVGAWCFADHFGPLSFQDRKVIDVAPHPHTGLQTVTWLFAGEVLHNDSLGYQRIVRPGELNLMTAGHGIAHSEETPDHHSGILHGMQFWLALPAAEREREPAFSHHQDLPVRDADGSRVQVFIGSLDGLHSPARVYSPVVGADIQLQAGAKLQLPLNTGWEYALLVAEGELQLGQNQQLEPHSLHYLSPGSDTLELCSSNSSRAVLLGGAPFGEPIVMWWNFVARSADEIEAARDDWQAGRRFGPVAAYQGKRLAAPELSGRPRASQ